MWLNAQDGDSWWTCRYGLTCLSGWWMSTAGSGLSLQMCLWKGSSSGLCSRARAPLTSPPLCLNTSWQRASSLKPSAHSSFTWEEHTHTHTISRGGHNLAVILGNGSPRWPWRVGPSELAWRLARWRPLLPARPAWPPLWTAGRRSRSSPLLSRRPRRELHAACSVLEGGQYADGGAELPRDGTQRRRLTAKQDFEFIEKVKLPVKSLWSLRNVLILQRKAMFSLLC